MSDRLYPLTDIMKYLRSQDTIEDVIKKFGEGTWEKGYVTQNVYVRDSKGEYRSRERRMNTWRGILQRGVLRFLSVSFGGERTPGEGRGLQIQDSKGQPPFRIRPIEEART